MTAPPRKLVPVVTVCVFVLTASIGFLAISPAWSGSNHDGNETAIEAGDDGLRRVHTAGITGENVSVGVVDVTGFDSSHPDLDGRVVDARSFGSGVHVDGGSASHGTAAASVVARTAPDAQLYLATFGSPDDYERAVAWLLSEDVDVIVAPVSFYGTPGDGTSHVERVATRAVRENVVFVASAGNLAGGHWAGTYDPGPNGTHEFGGDDRNYLVGDGRDVTVWLSWDRDHADETYAVELYRTDGRETRLVERSRPYLGDGVPNGRINARLLAGTYFVRVRGPPNATGAHLRLVSPTHEFRQATPTGSVAAPATARGVVGVGAYDPASDRVERYSSRGPTPDGRLGVDVVAPGRTAGSGANARFVGSSAAAPYVGGVVALVLDERPHLSPREVDRLLKQSATNVGEPGVDVASGYGRVEPWAAVRAARNGTA